jgi:hypothetical protein
MGSEKQAGRLGVAGQHLDEYEYEYEYEYDTNRKSSGNSNGPQVA